VLDTNMLVAALRSELGASRQLLLAAFALNFDLLVSVPLMLEYEAVLTRPDQVAAFRLLRPEVERFLVAVADLAIPVRLAFRWRPLLPDPADDMVLETAINGGATAIVTFDLRHFQTTSTGFRYTAMSPAEALQRMKR